MITTVEGDANAIGYVSLGSLGDLKAVTVAGVEATPANVKNGTYAISRPFNIAVKEGVSDTAKDFIAWILSAEGQKIVRWSTSTSTGLLPLHTAAPVRPNKIRRGHAHRGP